MQVTTNPAHAIFNGLISIQNNDIMKWTLATETIPESREPVLLIVKWMMSGKYKTVRTMTANQLRDIIKGSNDEYYWLDESPSPAPQSSQLVEALEDLIKEFEIEHFSYLLSKKLTITEARKHISENRILSNSKAALAKHSEQK